MFKDNYHLFQVKCISCVIMAFVRRHFVELLSLSWCCLRRLAAEAIDSFQQGAAELEVRGTDWNGAEALAALKEDVAAHVRGLEVQKVYPAEVTHVTQCLSTQSKDEPYFHLVEAQNRVMHLICIPTLPVVDPTIRPRSG